MNALSTLAAESRSPAALAWLVVVMAVVVASVALFVAALLSVLRSPRLTPSGRVAWLAAALVFPVLGPLAWFLAGRQGPAQVYRSTGA